MRVFSPGDSSSVTRAAIGPKLCEAPHVKRSIPHPSTDLEKRNRLSPIHNRTGEVQGAKSGINRFAQKCNPSATRLTRGGEFAACSTPWFRVTVCDTNKSLI